jgi:hypothetical protein
MSARNPANLLEGASLVMRTPSPCSPRFGLPDLNPDNQALA